MKKMFKNLSNHLEFHTSCKCMHKPNPVNSKEVIDGCMKGDRKYQRVVYEALYGKMMVVCLRYASDEDEAKDMLQEGFIKAFSKIKKYDGKGSFAGWISRIVTNNAIDLYRKSRNTYQLKYENLIPDETPVEEEDENDLFYGIKGQDVIEAMQLLSPAYKLIFNMYVIEDMTHAEIAAKLNISIGTSKSNLAKAKQKLRTIIKKQISLRYE